jgi:hypothetical protein
MIGPLLRRVAHEHCAEPLTATLANYSLGADEAWDRMTFQFRPIQPSALGGDENYLQVLDHFYGAGAEAHAALVDANLLGPACEAEPFCHLAGGRYLNAIYRGDLDAIRQMDHIYAESATLSQSLSFSEAGRNDRVTQVVAGVLNMTESQLLSEAANKYLHAYAAWGENCLDPGSKPYTFEHTDTVIVETDAFGVVTRSGGTHYEATYTLNPEFFPLRDRIGSYYGAADSDDPFNRPGKALVFSGIVEMKREYDCRSPEVKQFERQLLALTNRVLSDPGTTPPTQANLPPRPEGILLGSFPQVPVAAAALSNPIARSLPLALPRVAAPVVVETHEPVLTAAETARAAGEPVDISTMSALERQQTMTAEIMAAQERSRDELEALNSEVQLALRGVTASAERTQIVADFQARLTEARQRAEAETVEIQNKYQ